MAETPFELERTADRDELAAVFAEVAAALEEGRPARIAADDETVSLAFPSRLSLELAVEREGDPPTAGIDLGLEWEEDSAAPTVRAGAGAEGHPPADADTDADEPSATGPDDADPAAAVIPAEGVVSDSGDEAGGAGGRRSRFEIYRDRAGEWRWRLVHWNGNIVADSGEGYTSRSNAERAARGVMRIAPAARIDRLED
ncbi:amphi-Trp domain-containing protein [Salinilacihabitans rarus]|uniref:amphi-Trp domain-containing protein n=1 Tax=Salinilacihabitans rarus TaxID=2961596 RepID=UPI0020C91999|nr:amphi-Trp domain-containing protein [Salinilacihabitans rarus]